MKLSYYISIILFICSMTFMSCEQEETLVAEQEGDATSKLELNVLSKGYVGTRAISEGYQTKFTDGDEVGVFAVRNGKVVDNIDNRKFVFDEGVWDLEGEVIEYKGTEFRRMQFYAYYPYQEDTEINPDNEDPFESLVQNWKVEADQSGDNYSKSDLMTSMGEAEGQRLQGKISFIMQHRMALSIIDMPELSYSFTNEGIEDYHLPVSIGSLSLTANGETIEGVKPYYDETTGTYLLLVNPGGEFTINGDYMGAKEMEYTIEGNLESGSAKMYTIKDESKITHTLQVGDYYCADGTIVGKDANEVPTNCIGIVFYAGNPQPSFTHPDNYSGTEDALLRDFPSMNHGLVISLDNALLAKENAEGEMELTNKSQFAEGKGYFSNWFKSDEDWSDKFINNEDRNVIPGFLGYNGSKLMEMSYKSGSTTACTFGWQYLDQYRIDVPLSAPTTNWYLPSAYDMDEVAKMLHPINAQLAAVGGQQLESNDAAPESGEFYWAINERNDQYMWVHKMAGGADIALAERGSRSGYFRMILAF